MKESAALIVGLLLTVLPAGGLLEANDFDHRYTTYGEVLTRYVRMPRVDYAALTADRRRLDRVKVQLPLPELGLQR